MEDDDEFGDLYTDVLRPLSSPLSSSAPQPLQPSPPPPAPSLYRPIDLNHHEDDVDISHQPPHSNSTVSLQPTNETLPSPQLREPAPSISSGFVPNSTAANNKAPEDVNYIAEKSGTDGVLEKDEELMDNDVKFDIEEVNNGIQDVGLDPIIPGISPGSGGNLVNMESSRRNDDDDWDSDSEDDLHIVLNENNRGSMGMERSGNGMLGDDDDEEDDDELVIVAGGEINQGMEEREWGEEAAQGGDGERKDIGEAGEGSSGAVVAPKIGYSGHGYHPFHSQFKYVRPGAAPMPGVSTSGPGGTPCQVRPPVNVGPIAGRGRGDWRPTGIRNITPMQKSFHSGFGMPAWGNNNAGRGFGGGLEFTLPSHKTIFEVDVDSFQDKPWKYPGIDITDYYNFGLNEDSWKEYCKQLEQLRVEATMQSKIRVYESGRTEQDYDPDLPPELAAAAGIRDTPAENANLGKLDVPMNDAGKGSARMRPPLPTGRAIQVESGFGERLPSIDTRPPRIRDSDAIIEIVLQESIDDDSSIGNGNQFQEHNDPPRKDFEAGHESEEDILQVNTEYTGDPPQAENGQKTPIYTGETIGAQDEERQAQGGAHETSPHSTPSQNTRDKRFIDNQNEESIESMDNKHSPPVIVNPAGDSSVEHNDDEHDELVLGDENSQMEREEINFDTDATDDTLTDKVEKKQKLNSRVENPEEFNDEEESKAARSSENSKARSISSRDNQKWRESVDEEVSQDRRTNRTGRERDERERHRMVAKGREDSYPYRDWDRDRSLAHQLHLRNDGFDRQRRDDDPYNRKIMSEDTRKREQGDEMGSRHKGKVRETERSIKVEQHLHSKKQLDNGTYRVHLDKDLGSSRHSERDDSLKLRYENMDDRHIKRKKDEEYLRRDYIKKEEVLQGHRESTSHRKRERDEFFDPRKRDDTQRIRENFNDHHSVRQKDEWFRVERLREREEWHRVKQFHENKVYEKEHIYRDPVRHSEQSKRMDRSEGERSHHRGHDDVYARGNHFSTEERRSRQEKSSSRSDHAINASENQSGHEKKYKENTRKNQYPNGGDHNMSGTSKKNQEEQSSHKKNRDLKGPGDQGISEREHSTKRRFSRKHGEDASSDDEQQDSRRGRSKLERWTSHKERDFNINSKALPSFNCKEIDKHNNTGSSETRTLEPVENQNSLAEKKNPSDQDTKDPETKPMDDRHLDTVEKLKKRSERFKLPLPNEKEALTIKKTESESLPSAKNEVPADSEIKPERPARKRRWITN